MAVAKSAGHCSGFMTSVENSSPLLVFPNLGKWSRVLRQQVEQVSSKEYSSIVFLHSFCFSFCFQGPVLSSCPDFFPWCTVMWICRIQINPFLPKLSLVIMFYHSNINPSKRVRELDILSTSLVFLLWRSRENRNSGCDWLLIPGYFLILLAECITIFALLFNNYY